MIKRICNILSTVILIGMVLIAAILLVPYLFGFQPLAVLSGSMEPTYHVGSIVFVKKAVPEEIAAGDVITFRLSGLDYPATHRVVTVDPDKRVYVTKGDNNTSQDGEIPFDSLIGRASTFSVPLLGYVSRYIRTLPGILIACGVVLLVVLLTFLPDLLGKPEQKREAAAPPGDAAPDSQDPPAAAGP